MKKMLFSFLFVSTLAADINSCHEYLDIVKKHPQVFTPQGNAQQGEIEIILDPAEMLEIEKSMGRKVGLVYQDQFWTWINDACLFPSGKKGIYGRILHTTLMDEPNVGIAVMALLPDGNIVLNCNFRHATRSWEIELPRGRINPGETPEAGAKRETEEETGMVIDSLFRLGDMTPDTGALNAIVPIFAATVIEEQDAKPEDSEAIETIFALSPAQVKKGFLDGYIECMIRGERKKVYFRDPFLAYAFLLLELKKEQLADAFSKMLDGSKITSHNM